jgi:hypothetical protein
MNIDDVTLKVIDALNAAALPHLLVGAFSSNLYGIPRSTKDADFVVQAESREVDRLHALLKGDFELDPQLKFETNTGTFKQELTFRNTPFKVEVFFLSKDSFDQERFRRRRPAALFGRQTFVPTAEDVVVMKLRWCRAKDREDVHNVLTVQRGKLDWAYIENWCRIHNTLGRLEEIRRTVPEI